MFFIMDLRKCSTELCVAFQKRKAGGTAMFNFELYFRATLKKIASFWYKNRQWNRIDDMEMNHTATAI